jgi:nitroreductase
MGISLGGRDPRPLGRGAPHNQPWRFLVVQDKQIKDGLGSFTKYAPVITAAPVVIAVCMDNAASYNREKDIMAIGACIQNMLLQAHHMGRGACWLGEIINRKEEVSRYLKLDTDLEVMAVITLGTPAEKPGKGNRKGLKQLLIDMPEEGKRSQRG